jgi:hypothetical protein
MSCKCHDHDGVIGRLPSVFLPGGVRGQPPGSAGNIVIQNFPFINTGKKGSTDRFKWSVEQLLPSLYFDWADGDGTTAIAPKESGGTITLTPSGTITSGIAAPWQERSTDYKTLSLFDNGRYDSEYILDLSSGQDIIIVVSIDPTKIADGNVQRIISIQSAVSGFGANPCVHLYAYNGAIYSAIYGATNVFPGSVTRPRGFLLAGIVINRDGNSFNFVNGNSGTAVATPSLADKSDLNIIISTAATTVRHFIRRLTVFVGANIAEIMSTTYRNALFNAISGIYPQTGPQPTFTRTSIKTAIINNKLYIYSKDNPVSGNEFGMNFEPPLTNEVYLNYNPGSTGGLTATGGSLTTTSDTTNLSGATVDIREVGPNVFRFVNTSGSTQYVYDTPTTGDTTPRSLSVYARYISGSNVQLGYYDQVGTTFYNGAAISDNYIRTKNENQTPPNANCSWALEAPNNTEIYFVVQQMENWKFCTSPILNNLTAATASRTHENFDTNINAIDEKGSISFEIKINHIGTTQDTTETSYILSNLFGTGRAAYILGTQGFMSMYDGTNVLGHSVNVSDGNWHTAHVGWSASSEKMWMIVDGVRAENTYKGTWGTGNTGTWQTPSRGYHSLRNLRIMEN